MSIPTAPVVAAGLVGGYAVARFTKKRELGGVVLAAAGATAATTWAKKLGPVPAVALTALYLGAFGGSHPLAKKVGAWQSVGIVTAAATGVAAIADVTSR